MLTAIIKTDGNETDLAHTLASLVCGVTGGVLKRAFVFGQTESTAIRHLADEAGCELFGEEKTDLLAAMNAAQTDFLLLLNAGAKLTPDWVDEIAYLLNHAPLDGSISNLDPACFDQYSTLGSGGFLNRLLPFSKKSQGNQSLILKRKSMRLLLEGSKILSDFPPSYRDLRAIRLGKPHQLNSRLVVSDRNKNQD